MEKQSFTNPPFRILKCEIKSMLDETGDDLVHWDVTVATDNYEVWIPVWFDRMVKYCDTAHPETASYFHHVRRNIMGFGPKHSKMFDVFIEEGFDMESVIYTYIRDAFDLVKQHEWDQNLLNSPLIPQQAKSVVKDLSSHFPSIRNSTRRWEEFADTMLDFANKEALRIYPEILNADAEHIKKLHAILSRRIRELADDISDLYYKASQGKKTDR